MRVCTYDSHYGTEPSVRGFGGGKPWDQSRWGSLRVIAGFPPGATSCEQDAEALLGLSGLRSLRDLEKSGSLPVRVRRSSQGMFGFPNVQLYKIMNRGTFVEDVKPVSVHAL